MMQLPQWKYVQYSLRLLHGFLRRDKPITADATALFFRNICSPESVTRSYSQRAITQILTHVKMRTYSRGSKPDLWLEEYRNPLVVEMPIEDPEQLLTRWSDNGNNDTKQECVLFPHFRTRS